MKSKYSFLPFLLLLVLNNTIQAQTTNSKTAKPKQNTLSIALGTSWLWEPELAGYDRHAFNSMPSISYERCINQQWGIQAAFSVWRLSEQNSAENFIMYRFLEDEQNIIGRKFSKKKPYYVDVMGRYNLISHSNHTIKSYLGASLSWAELNRITFYDRLIQSGPIDFVAATEAKQIVLLGAMAKLAYQYTFCKNRLQIGAFSTFRYYPQLHNKQLDAGVQLGFNF
jgi:hypothetical protein